ncbi:MAG: response regulator transcription factor [Acidimicrobiia bacterium]
MNEPVAVLTPSPALRRGLAWMLAGTAFAPEEPDDPMAWVAADGHRVVLVAVAKVPDVSLVIDLRQAGKDLVVVALLPEITPSVVRDAVLAGICAVAGWDTSSDELVALLTAGVESRSIVPTHLLQELATASDNGSQVELDQEQVEWLRALARGTTVNQLAEHICYSEREVYRLLRALYDRLGVGNRTEALIWAAQRGLVG